MPSNVTYGLIDGVAHKSYKGFNLPSIPTLAAAQTFAGVVEGLSDAVHYSTEVSEIAKETYNLASAGDHGVELVGTALIEDSATGRTYAVSVPAISEANIDKNGTSTWKLTSAVEETLRAAFAVLTTLTCVVKTSFIQSKRTT